MRIILTLPSLATGNTETWGSDRSTMSFGSSARRQVPATQTAAPMMFVTARFHSALLAAATLALAVPAHGDASILATSPRPAKVAGFDGTFVWSAYDRTRRRWYLTAQSGAAAARRLPVAGRNIPFDVDVGSDASGRTVATYSRCTHDGPDRSAETHLPGWAESRGCRLYVFDLADHHERALTNLSRAPGSEFLPTMWKGTVAFARRQTSGSDRSDVPHLFVRAPSARHSREISGGPRNGGFGTGPQVLDIRGPNVAMVWSSFTDACPHDPGDEGRSQPIYTDVRVSTTSATQLLRRECSTNSPDKIAGVSWTNASLVFGEETIVSPGPFESRLFTTTARGASASIKPLLPAGVETALYVASDGYRIAVSTEIRRQFSYGGNRILTIEPGNVPATARPR